VREGVREGEGEREGERGREREREGRGEGEGVGEGGGAGRGCAAEWIDTGGPAWGMCHSMGGACLGHVPQHGWGLPGAWLGPAWGMCRRRPRDNGSARGRSCLGHVPQAPSSLRRTVPPSMSTTCRGPSL
jgi:hypothetical protein